VPGYFIAFEGGEGAGKSTQERLLAEHVAASGREVVRTREPGGTPASEAIRSVVLDPTFAGLDPHAEALLFAAARSEHVAKVIRPALERDAVVICDRYIDSSVSYQGIARNLGADTIRNLSLWATQDCVPDLTVVLDIDPSIGLSRVANPDRMEAEPVEFHQHVRRGFLELSARDPKRYLILDASASIEQISAIIRRRVDADLA